MNFKKEDFLNQLEIINPTMRIANAITRSKDFAMFIKKTVERFQSADWGDLHYEDKNYMDQCMKRGAQVKAIYKFPENLIDEPLGYNGPATKNSKILIIADPAERLGLKMRRPSTLIMYSEEN